VRIAGLYNMGNPVVPPLWNELQTAAQKLGLTPQLLDIRKVENIAPAFADATSQHADALIVSVDALTQKNRSFIAQLAAWRSFYRTIPTLGSRLSSTMD
jgi:hypothetical protein